MKYILLKYYWELKALSWKLGTDSEVLLIGTHCISVKTCRSDFVMCWKNCLFNEFSTSKTHSNRFVEVSSLSGRMQARNCLSVTVLETHLFQQESSFCTISENPCHWGPCRILSIYKSYQLCACHCSLALLHQHAYCLTRKLSHIREANLTHLKLCTKNCRTESIWNSALKTNCFKILGNPHTHCGSTLYSNCQHGSMGPTEKKYSGCLLTYLRCV